MTSSMVSRLGKDFQQPGAAYRGKPFWAWNGRLEPEELKRQIRHMHRMGLGGFFMHARVGLATPYLSEEWFAAVRTCVEEARRLGMEAWLYDEDRWPSGAAGGLVTRNPKYRMRSLEIEFFRDPKKFRWTRETLAAFTAVIEAPDRARDVRPIEEGHRPATLESERTIMAFRVELHDPSPWYNGQTYLDTMNPAAVRAFLRVTHDAYARRFAKDFGGIIPGIFTDEPNYGRTLPGDVRQTVLKALGLPWTDRLPTVFRRRYGYDLQPHLPELVFDIEGVKTSRARYHYHDCLTHLFVDAFARQCGEWCEKHGLQFTGHVLEEESLASQTNVVGSCMRFYEHMQAPGMDLLTERRREFITAKQVSSAARQFGRKWRLTETYGCTGWDFPFLGHKALGDWQAALGINLRCQHLYWYTMLAEAKRDYPAAIGHQSPWWDAYAKVEDYFARVQAVMTRGAEVRDVLVVHPVESVWMRVRAGWSNCPEIRALDDELRAVSDRLLEAHLDYDFGDEELLSRYGRIAVVGRRPALRVGRATYRAVVVPPQITMRRSTLELLKAFRRKGGRVVFAGRVATCLDAVPTDEVERFAAEGPRSSADGLDLATAVEDVARRVSIADGEGREIPTVLYLLREDAEAQYLFLCNTGERFSSGLEQNMARDRQLAWPDVRVRAFAGCVGVPLELDPETGATYTAEAEKDGDGWRLRTSLPALASRLFVTPRRATSDAPPRRWKGVESGRIVLEDGTWDIRRTEPNVLVLDRCAFRIGSDPEQPADEVLRVDARIRERMGLERRGGAMTQPWARPAMERPRSVPVELRYTIEVETPPEGPLGLGLERPEVFLLELNGVSLDPNSVKGWWTDASMQTLPVPPGALRRGTNELRLHLNYAETFSGLEPMYLLGEFGVRVEGAATTVIERPSRLRLGDWGEQGLPFYGGNVVYTRRLRIESGSSERVFLRLREFRGTAARIWTDGALVGVVAWPPFELEITESIRRAGGREIELAIEMLGHRRNSHGPLHYREKWPTWTGPGQMQPGPSDFVEFYQLVPCGLLAAPEAVVRRQAEGEEA